MKKPEDSREAAQDILNVSLDATGRPASQSLDIGLHALINSIMESAQPVAYARSDSEALVDEFVDEATEQVMIVMAKYIEKLK
jgi:hypothetical protein